MCLDIILERSRWRIFWARLENHSQLQTTLRPPDCCVLPPGASSQAVVFCSSTCSLISSSLPKHLPYLTLIPTQVVWRGGGRGKTGRKKKFYSWMYPEIHSCYSEKWCYPCFPHIPSSPPSHLLLCLWSVFLSQRFDNPFSGQEEELCVAGVSGAGAHSLSPAPSSPGKACASTPVHQIPRVFGSTWKNASLRRSKAFNLAQMHIFNVQPFKMASALHHN